jgi:hypothetical protein
VTDEFDWAVDPLLDQPLLDQHDPAGTDHLTDGLADSPIDSPIDSPADDRYGPGWPRHGWVDDQSVHPAADDAAPDRWPVSEAGGHIWSVDPDHEPAGVVGPHESMFQRHPTGTTVSGAADAGDPGFGGGPEVTVGMDVSMFPAALDLDVVPSDGQDWVDVDLLGNPPAGSLTPVWLDPPGELLADLHRLDAGDGTPSWQAVAGSDDPAVRALGLRWRPG